MAGPGAGKTTVLTHRIWNLILEHKVPPENILVITFTRAAAMEMKERFEDLVGEYNTQVVFGTFHSIFYHMLCESFSYSRENILLGRRKIELLLEAAAKAGVVLDCQKETYDSLFREFSIVNNWMKEKIKYAPTSMGENEFYKVHQEFQKLKTKYHLLEFDDMMTKTYQMLKDNPPILHRWQNQFPYILIDEIQDMNPLQFEIMKLLAQPLNNLFVVGDDDQSIYGFRGASSQLMLSFPMVYPDCKEILLETNYRCTYHIVRASLQLISHNKNRFNKEIKALSREESRISHQVFYDMASEHQFLIREINKNVEDGILLENMAILYRTNTQALMLMDSLTKNGITFHTKEQMKNIYMNWITLDIVSYLKIAVGIGERADYLRICNRPLRYISRDSIDAREMNFEKWKQYYCNYRRMLDRIEELEAYIKRMASMATFAAINYIRRGIAYDDFLNAYAREKQIKLEDLLQIADFIMESAREITDKRKFISHMENMAQVINEQNEQNKKIKTSERGVGLYTFHGAKGLEFEAVYIIDVNEGIMPSKKALTLNAIEEERRMFYVGITRAKRILSLLSIEKRNNEVLRVSRFVEEMGIKEAES